MRAGVQAVQIKSLRKPAVGATDVWWCGQEPFQGPCCGTCSNHFPTLPLLLVKFEMIGLNQITQVLAEVALSVADNSKQYGP